MSDSPHPFAAWMDGRMSQAKFAEEMGMSQSHLSLVLKRLRGLSNSQMVKAERVTGGAVPVSVLVREQAYVRPREAAQ